MNEKLRIAIPTSADRKCGIWVYSENQATDLRRHKDTVQKVGFVAIDPEPTRHNPETLITVIEKERKIFQTKPFSLLPFSNLDSWKEAGQAIQNWGANIVLPQHEYGLGRGFGLLQKELEKIGIMSIPTLHTTKFRPSRRQRREVSEILKHSPGIIVLNKKAADGIIKAGIYGEVDQDKIQYFPHPVRDIDVSNRRRDELKKQWGLEERIVFGSQGLNSCTKGIDKVMKAVGEIWINGDLTSEQKRKFIYVQFGDYHPGFKAWKKGNPCRKFDEGLKAIANRYQIPWTEFPGLKEFIEADLTDYAFVFVKHFLKEEEFRDAIALTDVGFLGNQDPEQAVTGIGSELCSAGPLIATDSLASRYDLLCPTQTVRSSKPMQALECDSGYIVAQGEKGISQIREAIAELTKNEQLRYEMDRLGKAKRPTRTWHHVMGQQIKYFNWLLGAV
jgi:hypothetical protein